MITIDKRTIKERAELLWKGKPEHDSVPPDYFLIVHEKLYWDGFNGSYKRWWVTEHDIHNHQTTSTTELLNKKATALQYAKKKSGALFFDVAGRGNMNLNCDVFFLIESPDAAWKSATKRRKKQVITKY